MVLLGVCSGMVAVFFACGQFELDLLIRSLCFLVLFADTRGRFSGLVELVTAMLKFMVTLSALSLVLCNAGSERSDLNLERVDRLPGLLVLVVVVMVFLFGPLNGLAVFLDLLQELFFSGSPCLALGDDLHPNLLERGSGARSTGHELHQSKKLVLGLDRKFPGHAGTAMAELVRGASRGPPKRMP